MQTGLVPGAFFYLNWLKEHGGVKFITLPESLCLAEPKLVESSLEVDVTVKPAPTEDFFEVENPWIFLAPKGQAPLSENQTFIKLLEALQASKAMLFECTEPELDSWIKTLQGEAIGMIFPLQSRVVCFSQSYARKLGMVWKGKLLALEHPALMALDVQAKKRAWALLKAWI
jgi:hypothetical protein